jgi:putative ABC transport system permease protein
MLTKLALRNLGRNRRRSSVTVVAIAAGFTAVCLFGGYVANMFRGLQDSSIYGEGLGHLTLAKRGYFEEGHLRMEDFVFSAKELHEIRSILENKATIVLIAPRFSLSGIVSNGSDSTIFIADAIGQAEQKVLRGKQTNRYRSGLLPEGDDFGIVMASELARSLNLSKGDSTVLFTSTLKGQANAYDVVVDSIVDTGNVATNDKFITLSLPLAQNLLDSNGAEKITLLLDNSDSVLSVREQLLNELSGLGYEIDIRTWNQLSIFYNQVRGMFSLIFLFIFVIVLTIVIMNLVNTMSMTVIERTREIGTLRALGMQRVKVRRLFSLEGFFLALVGCIVGIIASVTIAGLVNAAGLSYTPPGNSSPTVLTVQILPNLMLAALLILTLLATLFSLLPAHRAAGSVITDALGHV